MATTTVAFLCLALLPLSSTESLPMARLQAAEGTLPPTGNCPVRRRMEVLPGRGWDNLRNKDMGQVLLIDYSQCKSTEDGLFLLPNDVHASPIKASELQLTSELIRHWSNYTSITATSFKTNADADFFLWSIGGSYSVEYENAKTKQVQDKSQTTRVQMRNTMYSVQASPASQLDPALKKQFMMAMHELENENTEKADVILELIIRNYGTHYITQAEAGGVLYQEDFIDDKFVEQYSQDTSKVTAAAGASFLGKISFGIEYTQEVDKDVLQGYQKSQTSSTVSAIGGGAISPNMSVKAWVGGLVDNLVMTDRFGDPLSYLIDPEKFENVSLAMLGRLRVKTEDALKRYYAYNTHAGCTSLDSPNFDYSANIDDGSCNSPVNNYTFGGVFQECIPIQTDAGNLCADLNHVNPLTGALSCPQLYQPVALVNGSKTIKAPGQECHRVCKHFIGIPYGCHDECQTVPNKYQSQAEYRSYWCVDVSAVPVSSGYMFGGLYTSIMNNPVTKAKNCPPTYLSLPLGSNNDLVICASNDYELGFKYSVPFGGFFSCSSGNPLVTNGNAPWAHECTGGYSQHMATVDNGCEINYCVKANAFGGFRQITVIRPPFTNTSYLYQHAQPLMQMSKASTASDALSGGSVAFIVVSCIVTLLAGVGAVAFFRRRRLNAARRNDQTDTHQPLISDENNSINAGSSYGTIGESQPQLQGVHSQA